MKQPRFHLELRKNGNYYAYWYERFPDGKRIKKRRSLYPATS